MLITTFIIFLIILNFILIKKTNFFLNPFTIISIFFILPSILSSLNLSDLQSEIPWDTHTVIILFNSYFAWGFLPFSIILFFRRKFVTYQFNINKSFHIPVSFAFLIGFFYIFIVFVENYIISGFFFPILNNVAHEFHTQSYPLLNIMSRGGNFIVALVAIVFLKKKILFKPKNILFLFVLLGISLARGSRLDLIFSLISLAIILEVYFKLFSSITFNRLLKVIFLLIIILYIMIFIGEKRGEETKISYSYSENLQLPGILDNSFFAYFYGNFCLPFENLNRMIILNKNDYLGPSFTLMPLTNSTINFSKFLNSIPDINKINDFEDPVTTNGVSTALSYFYKDFGPIFSFFTMFFYSLIWSVLFLFAKQSGLNLFLYSTYSSAFAMSAFQPFILNPALYRRFILFILLILIFNYLYKEKYHDKRS